MSSGFSGLCGDSHQPLADKPPSRKAWGMGESAARSVLSFGDSGGECHALTKNCFFVGCCRRVSRTIVLLTFRGRRLESRSLWWCLDQD